MEKLKGRSEISTHASPKVLRPLCLAVRLGLLQSTDTEHGAEATFPSLFFPPFPSLHLPFTSGESSLKGGPGCWHVQPQHAHRRSLRSRANVTQPRFPIGVFIYGSRVNRKSLAKTCREQMT